MKYYAEHEIGYRRIISDGGIGWGNKRSVEDLLAIPYSVELEAALVRNKEAPGSALDLGCGTGPISLFLANRGYKTLGMDISESAIAKARELATQLGLNCTYTCDDFLFADFQPSTFDLVIDSSFLHCIVFDDERSAVLKKISSLLKAGGLFVVHTMTSDKSFDFGSKFEFDQEGILWSLSNTAIAAEAKDHAGGKASPQRRILQSRWITEELSRLEFAEVQTMHLYYNSPNDPASLFGVYRKL